MIDFNVGLDKLKETEQQVLEMQKSLDSKKIELQTKERQEGEMLQTIIEKKRQLKRRRKIVQDYQVMLKKKAKEMEIRQSQVNKM